MSEIRSPVKLFKSRESDCGVEQCVSITLSSQLTRGNMSNTDQLSTANFTECSNYKKCENR